MLISKVFLGVRQEGRNQHSLKKEGSGLWFIDEAGAASTILPAKNKMTS